jgi:hypothetical protein
MTTTEPVADTIPDHSEAVTRNGVRLVPAEPAAEESR